jgi:uncharacterized protein with NRDE domain
MCTVTLVPTDGGVRLACNRDEQRSRPAATPPVIRRFALRLAVLPLDPQSGGTWVAANDAGLVMAVLNVNVGAGPSLRKTGIHSRGSLIPQLLANDSLRAAVEQAAALKAANYAPFRLIFADPNEWAEVHSDARQIRQSTPAELTAPLLFTSSGMGDHVVEELRRRLFEELFARPSDPTALQNLFHWHRWPDRPHLSVNMSRDDACTVSRTIVTLDGGRVSLTYQSIAQHRSTGGFTLGLELLAGVMR